MDWEECFKKKIVKEIKKDTEMIKSLIESSKNKLESSNELKMNEVTAVSKFSLAYDSLRELLEALAIENGYKIYNHECFTSFLKEILNEKEKGNNFDEIRKIRNDVNYYGKQITIEEAEEIINKIKSLRQEIFNILKSS
jgi:hypothetical protein